MITWRVPAIWLHMISLNSSTTVPLTFLYIVISISLVFIKLLDMLLPRSLCTLWLSSNFIFLVKPFLIFFDIHPQDSFPLLLLYFLLITLITFHILYKFIYLFVYYLLKLECKYHEDIIFVVFIQCCTLYLD